MTVSGNLLHGRPRRGRKAKAKPPVFPGARWATSLPGRVILVALVSVAIAGAFSLLLRINATIPFAVLRWVAAAILGVGAGLAARALLSAHTAALRLWAALMALLAGLVSLGLLTDGSAGAKLPQASQTELNWGWLAQFLLGAAAAWLTLSAFPAPAASKARPRRSTSGARRGAAAGRRKKPAADEPGETTARSAGRTNEAPAEPAPQVPRNPSPNRPRTAAHRSGGAAPASASTEAAASTPARRGPAERPAAPSAAAAPASRSRSRLHPASPRGTASTPARPPLWTAPPPAVDRRRAVASRPGGPASQGGVAGRLQGAGARVQAWWRRGMPAPGEGRTSREPSSQAQRVQPRAVRPSAPPIPPPAEAPASPPAAGLRLPGWQALRSKMRPTKTASRAGAAPLERSSPVRLLGEEEHRCPFCLELVEPGDPRGMVECPICHTQHHGDCWAVTGACQVPHSHS